MAEINTDVVAEIIGSVNDLMRYEISIDSQTVDLCITLLRAYADRTAPECSPEIDAVIMLLSKVSSDIQIIRNCLMDYAKELNKTLA